MPPARTGRQRAPVASSSRRKPQPQAEESDSDGARQQEEEEDENEDEDEHVQKNATFTRFNLAEWKDQPLDFGSEKLVKGFIANWSFLPKDIKEKGLGVVTDTARALGEAGGDEDLLNQLDTAMRDLIDVQAEITAHTDTLTELRQSLLRRVKIDDALERYENGVKKINEEYAAKTARQKYGKNDDYSAFRDGVWTGEKGENEPMPPDFIIQSLPRDEADEGEESDEDIVMGGKTQDYRCPLTLLILEDPLTSTKCQHSYSRVAIQDFLKRGAKPCPSTGCDVMLTMADLEVDERVVKEAKRARRKAAEREEEEGEEAEEVEDDDDE